MRLEKLRMQRNASARKLARLTDVSHDTANRWFKGEAVPDANELDIIATEYDVSVDWLLGREGKGDTLTDDERVILSVIRDAQMSREQALRRLMAMPLIPPGEEYLDLPLPDPGNATPKTVPLDVVELDANGKPKRKRPG